MQNSKLPKPSSIKMPQSYTLRPLGTLAENKVLITKAHEAPPTSTLRTHNVHPMLRRRSRSVSDLKSLSGEATKGLSVFRPAITKPNVAKSSVKPPPVKSAPVKSTKPVIGVKRPLGKANDDAVSKPKVSKKIPDWDYKGRFNQLNEKYQHFQKEFQSLKQSLSELEQLKQECNTFQNQVESLSNEKHSLTQSLQTNIVRVECLESENGILKTQNESLNLNLKSVMEVKSTLEAEKQKLLENMKENIEELKNLREELSQYKTQTQNLEEMVSNLKEDLSSHENERRVLHNLIQDLKGNIRTFCRVRPVLSGESDKPECPISYPEENSLVIRKKNNNINEITGKVQDGRCEFTFDRVFPPETSQQEIFKELAELIRSALDGYNVCVLAYGQTGSGKTHTMQGGDGPERGMIPRAITLIFESILKLKRTGWIYTVEVSFLEIYNENLRDLLNLGKDQKLEICYNEGRGITVTNLTKQLVQSAEELEMYMRMAHQNRATAATDFNEHSSRSHAITQIFLKGVKEEQRTTLNATINLVDLAGSESAKNSVRGERLNETKMINKSLSLLGDVISALYNNSSHIPYRNSKLPFLLQSSLCGNSKTLMIVNVSPLDECYGESINTLRFAAKVKEVKTVSKKNKTVFNTPATPK